MNFFYKLCIVELCVLVNITNIEAKTSKRVFRRCNYDLGVQWSRQVGHSVFVSPPTLSDVNLDGILDIVAVPFTDDVTVIDTHSGATLPHTVWPRVIPTTSYHSSPIMHDLDGDGIDDIVLVSSDGEVMCLKNDGTTMSNYTLQLPGLSVQRDWYEKLGDVKITHDNVQQFVRYNRGLDLAGYVTVDAHVLASPILSDINNDNRREELIVPVSYYYDLLDYTSTNDSDGTVDSTVDSTIDSTTDSTDMNSKHVTDLSLDSLPMYVANAIVIVNITDLSVTSVRPLHLSRSSDLYPAYLLYPPTIANVDVDSPGLEIVFGTSTGHVFVLSAEGEVLQAITNMDSIHGKISLHDIDGDGKLELFVVDVSGHVYCYHGNGDVRWTTQVSGGSEGVQIDDVNADGRLDVVLLADTGDLYILDALDGHILPLWPLRISTDLTTAVAPVLLRLHQHKYLDIVLLGADGHVHIISGDGLCRRAINIEQTSVVGIMLGESGHSPKALLSSLTGHDSLVNDVTLLIASLDGSIISVQQTPPTDKESEPMKEEETVDSNLPFLHTNIQEGLIVEDCKGLKDYTGSTFVLEFKIHEKSKRKQNYTVSVYFGSTLLSSARFTSAGSYTMNVPSPKIAKLGHLHVRMVNSHGMEFVQTITARFNLLFMTELQWLLLCPFLVLVVFLLLLHGFPSADILPVSLNRKTT